MISMSRRWMKWSLVGLATAALGVLAWHQMQPKPVEVIVKPVEKGIVERTVANTRAGTVKACRRAKLSPSVGGQIAKLPIKKGDQVKEGQLLLELWNEDLVSQTALAKHELAAAQSRLRAVCLKADLARRNADRLEVLGKEEVVSAERVDAAVTEASALKAECESAQAEIGMRRARLAVLQADLERTRLVAPFDGVIAEINGELFEFVTPSPIGVATPPAVDIIENNCFYVAAPIDEVDAADIRVGMPARITMDAYKKQSFSGHVRRIADYVLDIEKQARTVDVEVSFERPPPSTEFLAGYSADIEVILEVRTDTVRVPTEALFDENKVYLFRSETGKLTRREIRKGIANWQWTEAGEGVAPGDLLVVNVDNRDLKDGAKAVRAKESK
jgi:HlyD family secretion protein